MYIAGIAVKFSPELVTIFGIRISSMLSYYDRFVFNVNTFFFLKKTTLFFIYKFSRIPLDVHFFIIILDGDKFSQKTSQMAYNIRHLESAFLS